MIKEGIKNMNIKKNAETYRKIRSKRKLSRLVVTGLCAAGFLVPITSFAATPDENKIQYGRHITDADAVTGKTDIIFGKEETIDVFSPEGAAIALALDNKETDVALSSEGGTLTLKAAAEGTNIYLCHRD